MLIKRGTKKIDGVTLVETLLVVSLGVIFVAMTMGLYNRLITDVNVRIENENISYMYEKLNVIYKGVRSGGLNNEFGVRTKVIPTHMAGIDDKIINVWKGRITLAGSSTKTDSFSLRYDRVPSGLACTRLIKKQAKVGWSSVMIKTKVDFINYDIGNVIKACNPKPYSKFLTLTFKKGNF